MNVYNFASVLISPSVIVIGIIGESGRPGFPGQPGLAGIKGIRGDDGLAGRPGQIGLQGQKGYRGDDAPRPPGPRSRGFFFTRHSQSEDTPVCPSNTVKMWDGFSLLYIMDNARPHGQDLGRQIYSVFTLLY